MTDDISGIVGVGVSALLGIGFTNAALRQLNRQQPEPKFKRRPKRPRPVKRNILIP